MSVGKTMSLGGEWGKLVEVRGNIDEISAELRGEEGEGRCLGALFKKVDERRARPCQVMHDGVVEVYQTNESEEISSRIRARLASFSEKVVHNKAILESIEQYLVSRTLQKNSHAVPVGSMHKKVLHEEKSLMKQVVSLQKRIQEACSRLESMPVIFLAKDPSETVKERVVLQDSSDEEFSSDESEEDVAPCKIEEAKASRQEEKSESLSAKPKNSSDDRPEPWLLNRCKKMGILIGCSAAVAVGVAARIYFLSIGGFCGGRIP